MNAKSIILFSVLGFLVISLVILISVANVGTRDSIEKVATSTEEGVEKVELPENLRNLNIKPDQRITSPVTLTGEARLWYFEASFPVSIVDEAGNVLAQAPAQAQDEWMTEEFVPFEATLEFDISRETKAYIVYEKDNASGLPEHAEEFRMPVVLIPDLRADREMTLEVYFSPLGPIDDCSRVVLKERSVSRTDAPARSALEALIEGPENDEDDVTTNIDDDTKINSISIENGVARVDFSKELNNIAGSCAVTSARAQIEETLKQFSTVQSVVVTVEGNEDEVLQP